MKRKFVIRLKPIHEKTGLSPYAVAKKINAVQNTVRKYVDSDEVVTDRLESVVLELCDFYGVDWRDPSIVEVVGELEESPESESLLIPA